jgi:hypothetical protein
VTQAPVEDPKILTMYFRAMSVLSPSEQEAAVFEGTRKWAEVVKEEDKAMMEGGFLIFGQAPPEKQFAAFMAQSQSDLYRCLLTDSYLDEYRAGAPPPESPLWSTLLLVGGEHWFTYWRSKFIRVWNQQVKQMGLNHLVYSRRGTGQSQDYE